MNNEGKLIYDGQHDNTGLLRFRTQELDSFVQNKVENTEGWGGSLYYYEINQWKSLPVNDIHIKLSFVNSTSYASEEQTKNIQKFTHGKYYKGKKLSNTPDSYNTEHKFSKLGLSFEDFYGEKMESTLKSFIEENLVKISELEKTIINDRILT